MAMTAKRKFAFALMASVALHVALLCLFRPFPTGNEQGRNRSMTAVCIKAFLVPGIEAAPAETAVLTGLRQTDGHGAAAPAGDPVWAIPEAVTTIESQDVNPSGEIRPSVELSERERRDGVFSTKDHLSPEGRESSGNTGPGVTAANEENRALPPGSNTAGTASRQGGMAALGSGDTDAVPRDNDPPEYPRLARLRGYQGLVILSVEVLADGRVGEVGVIRSSGHEILDSAALNAVREWRFDPGRRGGQAVTMSVDVPIRFIWKESSVLAMADNLR
jgi:TonB family protein